MIYLIMSSAFIDKNNPDLGFEKLLKIGYTKDDSKKGRFGCYITENPTCIVLHLIENGTVIDERNLHRHFKKYRKYGQEWFSYEQEILDFFKIHTTKESLDVLMDVVGFVKEQKEDVDIRVKVNQALRTYLGSEYYDPEINLEDIVFSLYLNSPNLESYLESCYPNLTFNLEPPKIDVTSFISDISSKKYLDEKLRYLCTLDKDTALSCLPYLPEVFLFYYLTIGPDRMKAVGFNSTYLKREYDKVINNQKVSEEDIRNKIIEAFEIGKVYSKATIIEMLRDIYDDLNYQKTPRAIDILEYFEVANKKITNKETGKRDASYLIIKIKEK